MTNRRYDCGHMPEDCPDNCDGTLPLPKPTRFRPQWAKRQDQRSSAELEAPEKPFTLSDVIS